MNQNMTKEMMSTAAMGTTIAGINVLMLLEDELLLSAVDVDVALEAEEVLAVASVA